MEEQEQYLEQPQVTPSPYYQPTIMPSDKSDLYGKIDPSQVVTELKFLLMGFQFNSQKGIWEKQVGSKGISEIGANEISTLMLSVSSKNGIISSLKDDDIRKRTKFITNRAIKMCVSNWKEYEISAEQIRWVKELVMSNTFITLKQCEEGGVRRFLGATSQEQKTIVEQPKQQGVISGIFRR